MASINLAGFLVDPTGEFAVGDQIRFTHKSTTGDTIKNARSVLIIPPGGAYDIDLEFGNILVEYLDVKDVNYKIIGIVTVNGDSTAVTLPELLLAIVPPTDEQLLEFQNILAEAEALVAIFATDEGAASVGSTVGSNVQQDLDALFSGQISGVVVFTTKALLDAFTPAAPDELTASYKVTNDPTSTNNGFYHWDGVSAFVKDADLVQNVIDPNNTSEAVSGRAVALHVGKKLQTDLYTVYAELENDGQTLTGGGFDDNVNYRHSDFLPTSEGDSFSFALFGFGPTQLVVFYDAGFVFISQITWTSGNPQLGDVLAPAGAAFVVFCAHQDVIDFNVTGEGDFQEVSRSVDTLEVEMTGALLDIISIEDRLIEDLYSTYAELENDGQTLTGGGFDDNVNYGHSDFVPTSEGEVYSFSLYGFGGTQLVVFYDAGFVFISQITWTSGNPQLGTAIAPAGAAFVVFCAHQDVIDFNVTGAIADDTINNLVLSTKDLEARVTVLEGETTDLTDISNMLPVEPGSILANYASAVVGGTVSQKTMFCMSHISDTHLNLGVVEFFDTYLEEHGVLDLGIITGDVLDASSDDFTPYSDLINANAKPFLYIAGNHDVDPSMTENDVYNKYIAPIATKLGITTGNSSYSIINATFDIKIIVMNEYNNTALGETKRAFSQAQIDWYIGELDDAITNGQSVLSMMHISPNDVEYNPKAFYQQVIPGSNHQLNAISGNVIGDLINAFKTGTNLTQTYTQGIVNDLVINHTFAAGGEFVAHLGGHWHSDRISYLIDHTDQLCLIANSGVPNEFTTSDLPRQVGEETEQCFNLYAIDTDLKKVYVVRVGANLNNDFKARQREVYDY